MNLLTSIKKYVKIYKHFWKISWKYVVQYRVDSFLFIVALFFVISTYVIQFGLVFKQVPLIEGWTYAEVLFVLGIYEVNFGIFKIFYGRTMEDAIEKIFMGDYDFFMLKPIKARFLAYFLPPLFKAVPGTVGGVAFLVFTIRNLGIPFGYVELLLLIFYILVSQLLVISFFQIAVTLAFFTGRSDEVWGIVENIWFYARYPKDIFSGKTLLLFTFFIPITLFASYPASVILGKDSISVMGVLFPLFVATLFCGMSNAFYRYGVSKYTSASS